MTRTTQLITASILVTTLSGCGGPNDFKPAADMSAADIYSSACQICHGDNGGGKLGFLLKIAGTESTMDEIASLLKDGGHIMPSFPNMSDEERLTLAAYVKAL